MFFWGFLHAGASPHKITESMRHKHFNKSWVYPDGNTNYGRFFAADSNHIRPPLNFRDIFPS